MKKRIFILVIVLTLTLVSCKPESVAPTDPPMLTGEPVSETTTEPEATLEPTSTEAPTEAPTETSIANDKPYEVVYEETFEVFDPFTEILSDDLLQQIGADGFSGTDKEIADQILQWQNENMKYIGNPMEQTDVAYPMRWNYFLPGIFPVSEMLAERVLPDGSIYGLCWDYAAIFSAIASTYGLETRVTAVKLLLSDINPNIDKSTANGLSYEEYEELSRKLNEKGVDFSFDQISKVAKETWAHYRAEVLIDDQWVSMDGSGPIGSEYDTFDEVTWYEGYDNESLYEANTALSDLDRMCEILETVPADSYAGMTDDAGDPNRAATIQDLVAGKGLAPYFDDVQDAIDFLELSPEIADELFEEELEIKETFEMLTGEAFYVIADALIYNAVEEIDAEGYVKYYEALTGVDMPLQYAKLIAED
jgi:transglutaminase-like putative cysteine protease